MGRYRKISDLKFLSKYSTIRNYIFIYMLLLVKMGDVSSSHHTGNEKVRRIYQLFAHWIILSIMFDLNHGGLYYLEGDKGS